MFKKLLSLLLILAISLSLFGCSTSPIVEDPNVYVNEPIIQEAIAEDGIYTRPEEVAEYIHIYEKLPSNYLTKKQAMDLGWESSKGNLWDVRDK